jgi:hypothetical protein
MFSDPASVELIDSAEKLEEVAKKAGSCLYDTSMDRNDRLAKYAGFLNDPGALYFSFSSREMEGYFRLYAGELADSRSEPKRTVLFEDVLRANLRDEDKNFFPSAKAIVLATVKELRLLDKSYLYQPEWNVGGCDFSTALRVRKLGSDSFKKNFDKDFYLAKPDERWNGFALAQEIYDSC